MTSNGTSGQAVRTALTSRGTFLDAVSDLVTGPDSGDVATLLCIGVDRYHIMAESLGVQVADATLQTLEGRLLAASDTEDLVVRLGDGRLALLCRTQGRDAAASAAQRISRLLSEPFEVDGSRLVTTVSIGAAVADRRSRPEALLSDASMALQQACQAGRAGTVLFDERLRSRAADAFEIELALHGAVERGEMRLAFQPTFELLGEGRINGVEALLRWHHPVLGTVSPDRFIPVAEETGLIESIGYWVLEQASLATVAWNSSRPESEGLTVAVNVSPRQFLRADFAGSVAEILDSTGLPAGLLRVEITERALLNDGEVTMTQLSAIKTLGAQVAIDDFGTGYSSLAYLSRFPVDVVKIDKAFVHRLGTDDRDSAVVSAVLAMAGTLGLTTVAEGIESTEQLLRLVELGCDEGQGYLVARPAYVEDLGDLGSAHFRLHQALGQRRLTQAKPAAHSRQGSRRTDPEAPEKATHASVLIVDDDATHLDLAGYVLEAGGFTVTVAATADELAQHLRGPRPDVVLMDLRMPDATGEELARMVHAVHDEDLPVVAVTSYPEWVAENLADPQLFAGSIPKPIDPMTFTSAVESFLPRDRDTG